MKKTLLTAAIAFLGISASFAQNWKAGDEITDQVNWGNLSFTDDSFEPWTVESSKGSFTKSGGLFEVYDGADVDLYQYVELKAGMYHLECQAYYRFGNSWEADPSSYGTDSWQDLAQLTVQNGTYSIDSKEFLGGRIFQAPIMPRLFPMYAEKIYTMPESESPGWDMSDGSYTVNGETVWGPCSVPGSLAWFNAGLYTPAEKDEVTYNRVSFFVAKDGYVKVGITKKEAKEADSFMATNFKLFYDGEISADYEFQILQDEVADARNKAYNFSDTFQDEYAALYTLMQDAIMETEGDEDVSTVESCKKYIDIYNQLTLDYTQYYAQAKELTGLIAKCEKILGNADDAAFKAALEAAKAVEQDGNDGEEPAMTDPKAYAQAAEALAAARDAFIKDFKNEDGSVEVTSYITYPWFCLPEYEPTWDAESNQWVPNETVLAMDSENGEGKTWSELDDVNGTIRNVAKGVNINSNVNSVGQWFQQGGGGNLEVYWNDNLTCIKKWAMPTEDRHDVSQRLSGIPNGYYKLKALAQTWMNDWANNCENHIYIKSNAMESHSPFLEPGGWWGKDINQWKELETDMILVDDGELIISSRDNGFAAFTGFRLFYYGETPDFNKLLAPAIAEVIEANSVENGLWAGDVKAVEAIMAKVPASITSQDEFSVAMETINEAKEYIATAKAAIEKFSGATMDEFSALSTIYPDGDENDIASVAMLTALGVGENETDTYLNAQAATDDAAMYTKYLDFVVNKAKTINHAALDAAIKKQYTELKAEYANAAKLADFMEELAAPYNEGVIASLGTATPDSPVDASCLIVNPEFKEGQKGYNGDNFTVYTDPYTKDAIIERWNTNSNFNQTIYSLPAGTYEIQVQAFYRDGGDAGTSFSNWIYGAGEDVEWWDTKGAILYANSEESYIRSIASEKFTDRMEKYCTKMSFQGNYDAEDNELLEPEWAENTEGSTNHPWDQLVSDYDDAGEEVSYFYPNSVNGSVSVWQRHPDAYWNSVKINLSETGNITFGIKEENNIGGDWVVANQFKLLYYGYDPNAISSVNATSTAATEIYNAAGVRTSSLQKGINIVRNGATVKKIFVK